MKMIHYVTIIILTILLTPPVFAIPPLNKWGEFKNLHGNHLTVEWDSLRDAPSSINGAIDARRIAQDLQINVPIFDPAKAEQIVEEFLARHEELVQLKSIQLEMLPTRSWNSPVFHNYHMIEYRQVVGDVPIEGTRAWVAIDENARIFRVGFRLHPRINLVTVPLLNKFEALKRAKAEFGAFVGPERREDAYLSILPPQHKLPNRFVINRYTLVWNVILDAHVNRVPVRRHLIIDAASGFVWVNHEIKDEFSATASGNINLHYLWDVPGTTTHTDVSISGITFYCSVTRKSPFAFGDDDYTDSNGNYYLSWNAINGQEYELYFSIYLAPNGTHVFLQHPFTASSSFPNYVYNLGQVAEGFEKDLSSTAWQADQMRLFFADMDSSYNPSTTIEINDDGMDTNKYDGAQIFLSPTVTDTPDILRHEYSHFIVWDLYSPTYAGIGNTPQANAMDEGIADFHASRSSRDLNGKSDRIYRDLWASGALNLDDNFFYPQDFNPNGSQHDNGRIISSALWDLIKVDPFSTNGDTLAYPHGFDHILFDALRIDKPTDFTSFRDALERIAAYWAPTYVQRVEDVFDFHGID
jgi:hypothetical protein